MSKNHISCITTDVQRAAEDPYIRRLAEHVSQLRAVPLEARLGGASSYDTANHDIKGVSAWLQEAETHLKENDMWSTYNPPRGFMTLVVEHAEYLNKASAAYVD